MVSAMDNVSGGPSSQPQYLGRPFGHPAGEIWVSHSCLSQPVPGQWLGFIGVTGDIPRFRSVPNIKDCPRSRLDCAHTQSDVSVHLLGRRAVMRKVSDKEREK